RKRLFQVWQWESGIEIENGLLLFGSFERNARPTGPGQTVTKRGQQRRRLAATRNTDDALRASQGIQFSGLLNVSPQEHQVFRRSAGAFRPSVSLGHDISRQQRQYFLGKHLPAYTRHAQEGAERTWNR